jgi:Peptidase family M1 domain
MQKELLLLYYLVAGYGMAHSQAYSDLGPQNNFQSPGNPYYWKNKLPFAGYWQQDVAYQIKATLDETTDIITGEENLTYTNNSPDTLYFVYFNLYQNAFQPGSYLDNLQRNNDVHPVYGKYERDKLGTVIDEIKSGEKGLQSTSDNTVMKVFLDAPIMPGAKKEFSIKFRTFYDNGSTRRRMKKYKSWGFAHYNGCQWYPKICVYDRKSGWNTDQHLNREFYGDFGVFDVELNFASNFVVEATGVLQNESEALPDTLKKKLDIYNFKNKKWDEKPSVITKYKKGERKTWKYHAENVHDFAFTADPTYRIHDTIIYPGRKNGEPVRCMAIVQEPHAGKWQNAADYLAKIISTYSRDFGVFEYPKIVVADASDGMEYPMITLDGGKEPDYRQLLAHEVGHNWFYGMLGNNETYRAMMDEGFTQFLTAWGLEHIDGKIMVEDTIPKKNWYLRLFHEPMNARDREIYIGYLRDAMQFEDEALNTHSDAFNGALNHGGGYGNVYFKTAAMLYNLQYVLGDSLFLKAMKHYVAQWKFAHPYPEDFRNSVTLFTHTDLNWFFDEWIETTKNIDYKVGLVKKGQFKDQFIIRLRRKGRMQMPIDLRIISKKDSIYDYYIPNTWFEKKNDDSSKICAKSYKATGVVDSTKWQGENCRFGNKYHTTVTLPKWFGWDKLQPVYYATVTIPGGIKNLIIDPSGRLADIDMENNSLKPKPEFRFDSHIYPFPDWQKYRIYMRPDVWWNAYDGLKVGVNVNGNYMNLMNNFSFTAWINTHLAQGGERYGLDANTDKKAGWFSYRFDYNTLLDKVMKKTTFYFHSQWLDGYEMYKIGLLKIFPNNFSADINIKAFTRQSEAWRNYLLYPGEWSTIWQNGKKFNGSLNLSATYTYAHEKYNGFITAHLRSGIVTSSFDYNYLELTSVIKSSAWKLDFRTRAYARAGTGSNVPSESALYFSGGNPEEMMDSKYYRAAGFAPQSWAGPYGDDVNHLQFGGGMNMRGYAGYELAELDKHGVVIPAYKGPSGVAINEEIDFNRIVRVKNQWLRDHFNLNTYLFGDLGTIAYINSVNVQELASVRTDAGVGLAFTVKKWGALQGIKPLIFRFDVPFFLSNTPYVSPDHFKFRWVVGIGRTF